MVLLMQPYGQFQVAFFAESDCLLQICDKSLESVAEMSQLSIESSGQLFGSYIWKQWDFSRLFSFFQKVIVP